MVDVTFNTRNSTAYATVNASCEIGNMILNQYYDTEDDYVYGYIFLYTGIKDTSKIGSPVIRQLIFAWDNEEYITDGTGYTI